MRTKYSTGREAVQSPPTSFVCVDLRSMGFIVATSGELIASVRDIDPKITFDGQGIVRIILPHGQRSVRIMLYGVLGNEIGRIERLQTPSKPGTFDCAYPISYRAYNLIKALRFNGPSRNGGDHAE